MLREQKGITLVALVITIIVLLILAGVSISLVVGNEGILTRATGAVVANAAASGKENIELAVAAISMDYSIAWGANTAVRRSEFYTVANLKNEIVNTSDYTISVVTTALPASVTVKDSSGADVTLSAGGSEIDLGGNPILVAYYLGDATTNVDYTKEVYFYEIDFTENGGATATFKGYTVE